MIITAGTELGKKTKVFQSDGQQDNMVISLDTDKKTAVRYYRSEQPEHTWLTGDKNQGGLFVANNGLVLKRGPGGFEVGGAEPDTQEVDVTGWTYQIGDDPPVAI